MLQIIASLKAPFKDAFKTSLQSVLKAPFLNVFKASSKDVLEAAKICNTKGVLKATYKGSWKTT